MASGIAGERSPLLNALLESFNIHARGLLDFLWRDTARPDDMLACHYSTRWPALRPQTLPPVLDDLNRRVGKEIAHLTYTRLKTPKPEDRPWNYPAIMSEMEKLLDAFLRTVPDECLCDDLRAYKRQRGLTS